MKCLGKIFGFIQGFQNNLKSSITGSDVKFRNMIKKDPISGYVDSVLDNSLREQLIKFFVEGNPANLVNRDDFFCEASKFVVLTQLCSITAIRREFSIGFSRAKLIIDQMESAGIIRPYGGAERWKVLVKDEISLNQLINSLPHVELSNCINLLDSFYEKHKEEIDKRRIEFEKLQLEKQKKTEAEAIKLMMLDKILKRRLPDHEYQELMQINRIFN
jgi:hypothetical protein